MTNRIKLTQAERMILINQLTILKAIDKSGDAKELDRQIEILEKGFETFYDRVSPCHLYEPFSDEDSNFVFRVLAMYEAIDHYMREHPDDAADLEKVHLIHFAGFDGNNESEFLTFTRFLLTKQAMFTGQLKHEKTTDGFNSHMPRVNVYRRQVERWGAMKEPFDLSPEQVRSILSRD